MKIVTVNVTGKPSFHVKLNNKQHKQLQVLLVEGDADRVCAFLTSYTVEQVQHVGTINLTKNYDIVDHTVI